MSSYERRIRVNWKLAVILLLAVAIVGAGAWWLHGYQVRRTSLGALGTAEAAEVRAEAVQEILDACDEAATAGHALTSEEKVKYWDQIIPSASKPEKLFLLAQGSEHFSKADKLLLWSQEIPEEEIASLSEGKRVAAWDAFSKSLSDEDKSRMWDGFAVSLSYLPRIALWDALSKYGTYLSIDPKGEEEVRAKQALAAAKIASLSVAETADIQRAVSLLETAAVKQPNNMELLRQQATLSMRTGDTQTATRQLRRLIKAFPDESEWVLELAKCHVASERFSDAKIAFQSVVDRDPTNLDAYAAQVALCFHPSVDDPDRGLSLLDEMVQENAENGRAYRERSRLRAQMRLADAAKDDLAEAISKAPYDIETLLWAAQLGMLLKELDSAEEYLQLAASLYPRDVRVDDALAVFNTARGDYPAAAKHLSRTMEGAGRNIPEITERLVECYLKSDDIEAARAAAEKARSRPWKKIFPDYLDARILIAQREWRSAAESLEQLRAQIAGVPGMRIKVNRLLGACYTELRVADRQYEAFQRVLTDAPGDIPGRIGMAAALYAIGRRDEALQDYRQLETMLGSETFMTIPGIGETMYRLLTAEAMAQEPDQRDWSQVETWCRNLEEVGGFDETRSKILSITLLAQQGELDEALKLATELTKEVPEEVQPWITRSGLHAAKQDLDEAFAVLKEASAQLGDQPALRRVEVQLVMRLPKEQRDKRLAELTENAMSLPPAERIELIRVLASAYNQIGDRETTVKLGRLIAAESPGDISAQFILFELAKASRDAKEMEAIEAEVEKIAGRNSAEWNYCEAARLFTIATSDESGDVSLQHVKDLLQAASTLRPRWHMLTNLEADIAIAEERWDDAIAALERTRELGSLSQRQTIRLTQLLYALGRFDEAAAVMDGLGNQQIAGLEKLVPEIQMRTGKTEEALATAELAVAESESPQDLLWFAQLLLRAEQYEKAEGALRRTLELDTTSAVAQLLLIESLSRQDKKEEAEAEVEAAEGRLTEDSSLLLLAQCRQLIGDLEGAEKHYVDALAKHEGDLRVLQTVVAFYLVINRAADVGKHLDQLITLAAEGGESSQTYLAWARRIKAELAVGGSFQSRQEALQLLERNSKGGKASDDDLRTKAVLLAKRPDKESHRQVIDILEDLEERLGKLPAREQFVLAKMYDSVERWTSCRQRMLSLLLDYPTNPAYLASFIQQLLDHDVSVAEISPWLEKLQGLQPDHAGTTILRAQMLAKQNQPERTTELLDSLIPRPLPEEQLSVLQQVAILFEKLEMLEEAERLLTEYAEKASAGKIALAGYHGRQGDLGKSLDLCEAAFDKDHEVIAVSVATQIVRSQLASANPKLIARLESFIDRAFEQLPDSKQLQLQQAAFLDALGQIEKAAVVYRTLLKRDDLSSTERAITENNLAFSLAIQDKSGNEAVKLASSAIEVLGPASDLLDTRGLALIAAKRPKEAIADLEQAIEQAPTAAKYFHLALAKHQTDDREGAIEAIQTARDEFDLTSEDLAPAERAKYVQMTLDLEI